MGVTSRIGRAVAAAGLALSAATSTAAEVAAARAMPDFIRGPVSVTAYDGAGDDLLTAGLGAAGLAGAAPLPASPESPESPTAAELRRLAIYNNYRALVDTTSGGGYGRLYGPGVGGGPEKIAGKEYLAYARAPGKGRNVTLMVQIPDSFDPARACIVTGPSSGSRGIYGAIGTSGEWGLKKGCAVAYTDKGTGNGAHDLEDDRVSLIDGRRVLADEAGDLSQFTARASDAERARFVRQFPHRYAWKHAHSETNPEADWGLNVVQSVELAFWALNEELAGGKRRFTFANTLVIGSSVSNGGGASLRAAEEAPKGMFDGIAVSEPNVNPRYDRRIVIAQEGREPLTAHSRTLIDYTTLLNLYQGCANAGFAYTGAVLSTLLAANQPLAAGTCQSLKEAGLLQAATLSDQAAEAQAVINDYGILPEQNFLQPAHWVSFVPQSISVTYANAYGEASVLDRLCGYSFAATSATPPMAPVELTSAADAVLFATANGIPPTGGVQLVNDRAVGGPARNDLSVSPSFNRQDQNVPGALCLRAVGTSQRGPLGRDLLSKAERAAAKEVRASLRQIRAEGELGGIPTVIVHGRADAILPPNHTSRPYYALSLREDGKRSRIAYYEVLNAHHLDAFNAFPDFAARFVPLHVYFIRALDLVYDHLTRGTPLPPSQVVRTRPRGDAGVPLEAADVPPIDPTPARRDRITFDGRRLSIPD